jgi:hypothetical protein
MGMLREPDEEQYGMRNKTHTDIQTYRHSTKKLGTRGLHVPDGKRELLPEPKCFFNRSVQGKDSGKNQAFTILYAR